MNGSKGGVAFAVIVVLSIAVTVGFVISPQPTSVLSQVIPPNPAYTNSTTLYANAAGWDTPTQYGNTNGAIPVNPTLNYTAGTVVTFTVIETDSLPHNLYIAKGTSENLAAYYSVIGAINPIPGSKYTGEWYAQTPGVYTYWCQVHPTTMVGTINVLPANSTSISNNIVKSTELAPVGVHSPAIQLIFSHAVNIQSGFSFTPHSSLDLNNCPCFAEDPTISWIPIAQIASEIRF
jgi:plastocyanin